MESFFGKCTILKKYLIKRWIKCSMRIRITFWNIDYLEYYFDFRRPDNLDVLKGEDGQGEASGNTVKYRRRFSWKWTNRSRFVASRVCFGSAVKIIGLIDFSRFPFDWILVRGGGVGSPTFWRYRGVSLSRCWDGYGHCNVLTPSARARGDAGRVLTCISVRVHVARFSNFCCCRLIEERALSVGKRFGSKRWEFALLAWVHLWVVQKMVSFSGHLCLWSIYQPIKDDHVQSDSIRA